MVAEIQGVKVHNDVIIFQRICFSFLGHILAYILLEPQFNAEQSFLGNHFHRKKCMVFEIQGVKVNDDVIIL